MKVSKMLLVAILLVSSFSNAQIARITKDRVSGNAVKATYYYLPEIESYYDIRNKKYIYARDGKWFTATNLPAKHKAYHFGKSRKIALTDKSAPYKNFGKHKSTFFNSITAHKRVVRPGNSGNAPGHNKVKYRNEGKHHGRGHGENDSKHGGKHNKK